MSKVALLFPQSPVAIIANAALSNQGPELLLTVDRNEYLGTGTSSVNIDLSFATAITVDALAMAHTNLSASATITVKAATSLAGLDAAGVIYSGTAVDAGDPTDRPTIFKQLSSNSYQYWRVAISDAGNPSIEVSRLMMGQLFSPAWGVSLGLRDGFDDGSGIAISSNGQAVRMAGVARYVCEPEFSEISQSEWNNSVRPFLQNQGMSQDLFWIEDVTDTTPWLTRMWCFMTRPPRGVRQILKTRAVKLGLKEL